VKLTRTGGEVRNVMDHHRQEREVELAVGGGDRVRGALAVDDTGVRAAALGLGTHLFGRLDADDARVECVGQASWRSARCRRRGRGS